MIGWLLQAADFMPHGMCLLWRPGLMALHIISDALIALAYFAIPLGIFIFVQKRPDLNIQHKALAGLFVIFITACGLTHVMSILVLWRPYYVAEGVLKAVTAGVSVITALALPFLIPQLLRIPSPRVLASEIAAHKVTLLELQTAREKLASRVEETEGDLLETTRRFQTALRDSPVTVFEQDANLRYTWVYNPPLGLDPVKIVGGTESDFFTTASTEQMRALKRDALAAGEPRRQEIHLKTGDRSGWYDMRVEPVQLRDGRPGLVATSTEITALKLNEQNLNLVMRELNHRAKNLLTIVISIARQTARGFDLPRDYLVRFEERLASLASAHDVLASQNWTGAELNAVIQGQLKHQLQTYGGRIILDGGACVLPPEAAHYIGMALHELGSNAVKYGALSGEFGSVTIRWRVIETEQGPTLDLQWWEEGGKGVVEPTRLSFGSTILKTLAPRALDGAATLSFDQTGVRWALSAPLPPQTSPLADTAAYA